MADAPGVETPVTWLLHETITRGTLMHLPAVGDFWGELDADVLRCLADAQTPAEIGRTLGMSEQAVCSILGMLAEAGKVRITAVERIP